MTNPSHIARADESVTLVLPYPISSNRYWRPVRIGNHITIVPTKEAKAYKQEVAVLSKAAGARPIAGRVSLQIKLYPGRPQDWAKRAQKDPDNWDDTVRSIDIDNALKVLLDALKDVAFGDDSWVRSLHAERCVPDDKGARVVVTVTAQEREVIAPDMFRGAA